MKGARVRNNYGFSVIFIPLVICDSPFSFLEVCSISKYTMK